MHVLKVAVHLSFVSAECTTASLEVLKKCLDGVKFNEVCLEEVHKVCCFDVCLHKLIESSLSEFR